MAIECSLFIVFKKYFYIFGVGNIYFSLYNKNTFHPSILYFCLLLSRTTSALFGFLGNPLIKQTAMLNNRFKEKL